MASDSNISQNNVLRRGKLDFSKLKEVKDMYNAMIGFFDALEKQGAYQSPVKNVPLSGIMMVDLSSFMLYMSASDGSIDSAEVDVFRYITDMNVNGKDMVGIIKNSNIYSTEFESRVPATMQIAVDSGINFNDKGNKIPLAVVLFEFYKMLGAAMVAANNEIDKNEKRDFGIYLTTLANYLAKHGYRVS